MVHSVGTMIPKFLAVCVILSYLVAEIQGQHTIIVNNNCKKTLWIGFIGSGGKPSPYNGGFILKQGEKKSASLEYGWEGRVWPRTGCAEGRGCRTGDCASGKLECGSLSGERPATLAEFRFNGWGDQDYYDVSLVDGFNLPVIIDPFPSNQKTGRPDRDYDCTSTGCYNGLEWRCPSELKRRLGDTDVCLSACSAYLNTEHREAFCCEGRHNRPETCRSSDWFKNFPALIKAVCPQAYSYAYDDAKSTWTCKSQGSGYTITFCP